MADVPFRASLSKHEVRKTTNTATYTLSLILYRLPKGSHNMTLTATTKLSALKLPTVVEKDGVRYTCDIVDDDQGIDLVLEKEVENEA